MKKPSLAEIKSVSALGHKKFREETGLFVVEGEKMVAEALKSDFEVIAVYRVEDVGEEIMARMSTFKTPSPILAVLKQVRRHPAPIPAQGLFLALDSIRDPGNMGTILRIADWFAIKAVYASPDCVELYNPKTVQATMGAIFRVPVYYCDLPRLCAAVGDVGGRVYGTLLDGNDIYGTRLDDGCDHPVLIVTGNESEGISSTLKLHLTDRLCIPRGREGSESLNAAVATAVVVAEFCRQVRSR